MLGCNAAQRTILATGRCTAAANAMARQIRALHITCHTVCGRQALQPLSPLPLHLACSRTCPGTLSVVQTHCYSSPAPRYSNTERIKVVLKEYGSVAIVFHTVMSLCSLGTCYLIVNRSEFRCLIHVCAYLIPSFPCSGVDVGKVLEYFNVQSSATSKGASTFAVAYILHKMLLPLRAGITVAAVPLIVRWLRARGWVKGVVKQMQPK